MKMYGMHFQLNKRVKQNVKTVHKTYATVENYDYV